MSGDAPMGASQAKYAQVAQDEGQKPLEVEAPSGPLGSGAPPVMRKPAFWAAVLVVALGASVMLSGPAAPPVTVEAAPETDVPTTSYSTPTLRGTEDSTLTALIAENSRLRADLASKSSNGGASDEAFSALFEENGRLRAELAQKPSTGGEFDIGAYRAERLAATPPKLPPDARAVVISNPIILLLQGQSNH